MEDLGPGLLWCGGHPGKEKTFTEVLPFFLGGGRVGRVGEACRGVGETAVEERRCSRFFYSTIRSSWRTHKVQLMLLSSFNTAI